MNFALQSSQGPPRLQHPLAHIYNTKDQLFSQDIVEFLKTDCSYYFFIDHRSVLDNPEVLNDLLSLNKNIVAPFIRKSDKVWSNFWADLDSNGYYNRSPDYFLIINGERRDVGMYYISVVHI